MNTSTRPPGMTGRIESAARERFGEGARPAAIVLTHGHFDHVGCLEKLAEKWDAPIYAHPLRASVEQLATLAPAPVVTGHGRAMQDAEMCAALQKLARDFHRIAMPASAVSSAQSSTQPQNP